MQSRRTKQPSKRHGEVRVGAKRRESVTSANLVGHPCGALTSLSHVHDDGDDLKINPLCISLLCLA